MQVEVSRLAQGNGTDGPGGSSNQTRKLGPHGLTDLFDAGYENGVALWDSTDGTAWPRRARCRKHCLKPNTARTPT